MEDYRQRTVGVDEEEKKCNMAEIWAWVGEKDFGLNEMPSLKSITARMLATKNQLTTLVRSDLLFAYLPLTATGPRHRESR